jgi:hypothetical protein
MIPIFMGLCLSVQEKIAQAHFPEDAEEIDAEPAPRPFHGAA